MALETHSYDGKLNKWSLIDYYPKYTDMEYTKMGMQIIAKSTNFNRIAMYHLIQMVNEINDNDRSYDPTNDISVGDLLFLCKNYIDNQDFMNEFEIQLTDMQTGFCPQGRTHRLFQLLLTFK
jgi:hypothetical protein